MKLFVLFFGIFLCTNVHGAEDNESLPIAAYMLKSELGYTQLRAVTGQVVKQNEAHLSFEFTGKIQHIFYDQGDWVDKGQVIATQDTQLLAVEKLQLEAQQAKLGAQLKLAKTEQARFQKLSKQNYSAAQQLDEVTSRIEVIYAEQAVLAANLKTVEIRIEKAKLRAPFAGLIGSRAVQLGEVARTGQVMFKLLEQNRSQVVLGVPTSVEQYVNETMTIVVDSKQYQGKLLSRGALIDDQSRTLTMRFQLPEHANVLAGSLARMVISTFTEQAGFWVPLSAITDGVRGTWQVYAIKENTIIPVSVNVHYTDGEYVFVSGALTQNDRIVANGLHKVATNIAVEVVQTLNNRSL